MNTFHSPCAPRKLRRFLTQCAVLALSLLPAAGARAQSAPALAHARAQHGADTELAREARLETILNLALARSPEIAEAEARTREARERAPAASRLPDPEFKYEMQGTPLARPYALNEAQMHMFGLRQMFPAPGTRGAQSRAQEQQTGAAAQLRRAREQDITARVRRAFAEYHRAHREYEILTEHVAIARQVVEVSRATYGAGRGSQQDVLRSTVELSRLRTALTMTERDRRAARGLLNTLMNKPADSELGPPALLQVQGRELRIKELERSVATRPEVLAAEHATRSKQNQIEAARAASRWPSFMVGVDYQYMPMDEHKHGYGVMFSMSLPWLSSRYGDEVRASEAALSAEQSALSSVRNTARYQLYEAISRAESSRETLLVIEQELLPQARQSFEAAQASYRGGQGDSLALLDALRSLLDVRIERERALASLSAALADVERAAGSPAPVASTKKEK